MTLSKTFVLAIALTLLATAAQAELRVRECSYNIHEAHVSTIREDNYFQSPLEMTRLNSNHFVGSKELSDGYILKVDAVLKNGKITVRSQIRGGQQIAVAMLGSAPLSAKTFLLNAKNLKPTLVEASNDTEPVTVFDLVQVRCSVAPTRISDRLFDWAN